MKKIILTIDYELFLGKNTGTVKECMVDPTYKLASFLSENNSKMTVFWDVLHYYRLLQLENDFPALKEDKYLIEKQILDLVRNGHDIQLHLHPHWLDAKYKEGRWVFIYDRYRVHNLSGENRIDDINTITGCFTIAKNLIEDLIRKTDPDYKVTTFRAGGLLIEPFSKLSNALIENEIRIGSTVCPDFYEDNGIFSFDFRNYPRTNFYRFESSLKNIDREGKFIEIPISTVKIPIHKNILFTAIRRLKYTHLEDNNKGVASVYSVNIRQKSSFSRLLKILTRSKVNLFSTDGNFEEKFNYMFNKVPEKATMIIHPKSFNEHTLNLIKDYINDGKVKFLSISDHINSSGNFIISETETIERRIG